MVELNHIIKDVKTDDLKNLQGFEKEMQEYITELRDSSNQPHEMLLAAFSFTDEYASGANKEEVMRAGYDAYKILNDRGEI